MESHAVALTETQGDRYSKLINCIGGWRALVLGSIGVEQAIENAFYRTLLVDTLKMDEVLLAYLRQWWNAWHKVWPSKVEITIEPLQRLLLNAFQTMTHGRRMFLFELEKENNNSVEEPGSPPAGLFGLTIETLKVSDIVCLLFGCNTPVVLRPRLP